MKTMYKNFKIGQNVILNEYLICEGKHFDKGHNFKIISFPPCVIYGKYQYFIFGKDDQNNIIRCNVNQIIKQNKYLDPCGHKVKIDKQNANMPKQMFNILNK